MQSPPFSGKVLNFKCINHWLFLCFSVSKNPSLHLKHTTIKNKKKIRKKNPVSPVKKIQSPLKNKLIGSPAKNMPATSGSPQKLIDGFLKQEGRAAQVLLTQTAFGKAVSASLDWVHVAIFLSWILHWHLTLSMCMMFQYLSDWALSTSMFGTGRSSSINFGFFRPISSAAGAAAGLVQAASPKPRWSCGIQRCEDVVERVDHNYLRWGMSHWGDHKENCFE